MSSTEEGFGEIAAGTSAINVGATAPAFGAAGSTAQAPGPGATPDVVIGSGRRFGPLSRLSSNADVSQKEREFLEEVTKILVQRQGDMPAIAGFTRVLLHTSGGAAILARTTAGTEDLAVGVLFRRPGLQVSNNQNSDGFTPDSDRIPSAYADINNQARAGRPIRQLNVLTLGTNDAVNPEVLANYIGELFVSSTDTELSGLTASELAKLGQITLDHNVDNALANMARHYPRQTLPRADLAFSVYLRLHRPLEHQTNPNYNDQVMYLGSVTAFVDFTVIWENSILKHQPIIRITGMVSPWQNASWSLALLTFAARSWIGERRWMNGFNFNKSGPNIGALIPARDAQDKPTNKPYFVSDPQSLQQFLNLHVAMNPQLAIDIVGGDPSMVSLIEIVRDQSAPVLVQAAAKFFGQQQTQTGPLFQLASQEYVGTIGDMSAGGRQIDSRHLDYLGVVHRSGTIDGETRQLLTYQTHPKVRASYVARVAGQANFAVTGVASTFVIHNQLLNWMQNMMVNSGIKFIDPSSQGGAIDLTSWVMQQTPLAPVSLYQTGQFGGNQYGNFNIFKQNTFGMGG